MSDPALWVMKTVHLGSSLSAHHTGAVGEIALPSQFSLGPAGSASALRWRVIRHRWRPYPLRCHSFKPSGPKICS